MEDKWQALLEGLEIESGFSLSPCNVNEIADFEARFGVILPTEYKQFCQVFGAVSFGREIFIGCTNFDIESQRGFDRDLIAYWREHFELVYDDEREAFDRICDLVEKGIRFGGTPNSLDFWFDLRTYGSDKSYDIYYVSVGDRFALYKLGRSFFDFVREYCLGTKLYDPDSIPENMIRSEQHQFFISGA